MLIPTERDILLRDNTNRSDIIDLKDLGER